MSSFYSIDELKYLGIKKLGENVSISKKASIYGANNIEIGDNVRVDDFCILSGKIVLGNYIHIAAATLLYGGSEGIQIESFSTISSRSAVYALSDDYTGKYMTNPMVPDKYKNVKEEKVIIKKHVIVGTNSTILPGTVLGEGVAIGACSLVLTNCDEWSIYVGLPAKKIKEREKNIIDLEKDFLMNV